MEKESYKNSNISFKDVHKDNFSGSTATAAPAGSGTVGTEENRLRRTRRSDLSSTASSAAPSGQGDPALLRRFKEMFVWDAQDEGQRMSEAEKDRIFRAAASYAIESSDGSQSEDDKRTMLEKFFLLSPDGGLHIPSLLLGKVVGSSMLERSEGSSERKFIDSIPGVFGKTCSRTKADYLAALNRIEADNPDLDAALARMEACQKELVRCLKYARAIRDKAERVPAVSDWKADVEESKREDVQQFAKIIEMHFGLIVKELERLEPIMKEGTDFVAGKAASKPRPKDARLVELNSMSPDEVHSKLISDEAYRAKSDVVLRLAKDKLDKDDMDMFEKLLLLGVQGGELEAALEKVKGPLRRGAHTGWLGSEMKKLQEGMNKAPTVPSGWGMLGELVVIALFVGLAALLYLHPAVPPFVAEVTGFLLPVGMIVCFVVGLAGGLIGGVLAALAWAGITYVINLVIPLDKAMHVIVCILALAPSLLGLGWMLGSTPSARRKSQQDREKHIAQCHKEGEAIIEYINDLMVCILPKATTDIGQSAKRYYQSAVEKMRRMHPEK